MIRREYAVGRSCIEFEGNFKFDNPRDERFWLERGVKVCTNKTEPQGVAKGYIVDGSPYFLYLARVCGTWFVNLSEVPNAPHFCSKYNTVEKIRMPSLLVQEPISYERSFPTYGGEILFKDFFRREQTNPPTEGTPPMSEPQAPKNEPQAPKNEPQAPKLQRLPSIILTQRKRGIYIREEATNFKSFFEDHGIAFLPEGTLMPFPDEDLEKCLLIQALEGIEDYHKSGNEECLPEYYGEGFADFFLWHHKPSGALFIKESAEKPSAMAKQGWRFEPSIGYFFDGVSLTEGAPTTPEGFGEWLKKKRLLDQASSSLEMFMALASDPEFVESAKVVFQDLVEKVMGKTSAPPSLGIAMARPSIPNFFSSPHQHQPDLMGLRFVEMLEKAMSDGCNLQLTMQQNKLDAERQREERWISFVQSQHAMIREDARQERAAAQEREAKLAKSIDDLQSLLISTISKTK